MNAAKQDSMSSQYKWYVVAMLWWISFFNYADRQAIFSVFPLLQSEMGLTKVELGLLGSSFAWMYGLCAPFAGAIDHPLERPLSNGPPDDLPGIPKKAVCV